MKYISRLAFFALMFSVFGFALSVSAAITPVLSLLATGNGDNVQISVNGEPNTSILLSYNKTGTGLTILPLGTTNSYGTYSNTVSSSNYGFVTGTTVTALLNGVNGIASNQVAWPSVTSDNSLTLNQNALVINTGSSENITATNFSGTGSLYVSNNSNPSIVNVGINGTTATVYGNIAGSTTITLCQVGGAATNCPSIYVVVKSAGTGRLSFSQTNATVVSGQNLPITISGGNSSYLVANNSNSNVIQTGISGSVITLTTGATKGTAGIIVCSSDMALCGTINATVGNVSSVSVSFNTTTPTIFVNQSTTVNIYGPSGISFYVSSNVSPSIVQAYISGSTLTLTGISAGTSAITVCASTGNCGSLTATVSYSSGGGALILSQNTISLNIGQSVGVTISGGSQPYNVSGGSSSVSQQNLSGNTLTVYGVGAGTSSVDVCSSRGACVSLFVTVNGSSSSFSIDPGSISITVGQTATVSLSGGSGYSLSGNTNSGVASVSISGSSVAVSGISAGTTNATICSNNNTSCRTLSITVSANIAKTTTSSAVTTSNSSTRVSSSYFFGSYLAPNSQNADVLELQKILTAKGYLSSQPNGYYGPQTKLAVMKFQTDNGLEPIGVVGPATRAALNQNTTPSNNTTSDINSMSMSQLQARLQSLQQELSQILTRISQLKSQGY